MLTPPLYCSICSSPCLLPRLPLPVPSSLAGGIEPSYNPEEWLSAWYCLRVSTGLTNPIPFLFQSLEPSSLPLPLITDTPSIQPHNVKEEAPRRSIPIHAYCLSLILRTTHRTYSNTRTHEEKVLLNWSLPKWTGYFPWSSLDIKDKEKAFAVPEGLVGRQGERNAMVMMPGYWGGMWDQRARFARTGDHLMKDDLISPISIPPPVSRYTHSTPVDRDRSIQSSRLFALPTPILTRIIESILDDPPGPSPSSSAGGGEGDKSKFTPFLYSQSISSFLSFSQTCSTTYHFPLPSHIWRLLVVDSVKVYRNGLLQRWRANPTGVGSALQLWESLGEEFDQPVNTVIESVMRNNQKLSLHSEGSGSDHEAGGEEKREYDCDMKDVWVWWNYSKEWKSKRRVWKCVVHATATARDADWW
ncbi:hypothetical protein I302_107873 [Kwoniella bestiolae CBS 10118]|uniref:Uncharacterized protein n=1 Tax=Kwoniella bestiolae CBS 10118 TaxID=1296100 RepID=A0A1B9FXB1_9TREE|nr:hypothetical protein I302_06385 [Kwoniella bestiolae CBS 10118]OCF23404.1 hypothetical protein I302_06385 [Kwoniella bestiolae CBS 10118]